MIEETFYENVEILDESYTVDTVGDSDVESLGVSDCYVDDGNVQRGTVSDVSGFSGVPSVGDGDKESSGSSYYTVDVSGNSIPFSVSGSDVSQKQMEVQDLSANDLEPYFTAINYRLDTIIFLLLSFWCIKKIKIAVANFTGRSLDGRKDGLDK